MEAVIRDFGDRNPQEDPIIHFYELFLTQYDARKRMQRGVFYTPRPIVSYIVRSAHELLRKEFGLTDGLADIATWGEVAARNAIMRFLRMSTRMTGSLLCSTQPPAQEHFSWRPLVLFMRPYSRSGSRKETTRTRSLTFGMSTFQSTCFPACMATSY